jgi:predicted HTH domain antitoxin
MKSRSGELEESFVRSKVVPVIALDLPDTALSALRRSPDEFARDMRLAAAIHWYARGIISQEKASQIAGLSRTEFLLALAREQVPTFHVDFDQLQEELCRG